MVIKVMMTSMMLFQNTCILKLKMHPSSKKKLNSLGINGLCTFNWMEIMLINNVFIKTSPKQAENFLKHPYSVKEEATNS